MKAENRIIEKDEHSHKIKILNQNSNSILLGVDPWSEKRKKNEEQLREKERKDFDPKACITSNQICFYTN